MQEVSGLSFDVVCDVRSSVFRSVQKMAYSIESWQSHNTPLRQAPASHNSPRARNAESLTAPFRSLSPIPISISSI
jgi:hypothetical protein